MSQSLIPFNQENLTNLWQQMSTAQRVGLGALITAALTALIFFLTWSQTPDYTAAFTDLAPEDGSAIVEYLKENSIPYQLDGGGATVRVPADRVNEVRLALAGQGLPGKGTVGFELFDTTNLGITDFTQQINYQRALEGELARTISSLKAVQSARVHIVIPQPTLFAEEEAPTTASVIMGLESGQVLNKEQISAVTHLVASAVEGLAPENLTIVDMDGNVLSNGSDVGMDSVELSANQITTQRAVEKDMEHRIETMLENVLGPDKAVVRVSADMNWDQVETQNEIYAPDQTEGVVRSSRQVVEQASGTDSSVGGVPGASSNVPNAAPSYQTEISGTNGSSYQHSDVTTNYEISRSSSHIVSGTGQVKRLSVSVLVDNITDTTVISAIYQSTVVAAGLDTARGDAITVNSIPFDRTAAIEEAAAMDAAQQREFYLLLARWGVVAVAMVGLFFVVRGMQRSLRLQQVEVLPRGEGRPALATAGAGAAGLASGTSGDARANLLEHIDAFSNGDAEGGIADLGQVGPPQFNAEQQEAAAKAQMVRQLQLVAKNRPETMAQVIQFWMSED